MIHWLMHLLVIYSCPSAWETLSTFSSNSRSFTAISTEWFWGEWNKNDGSFIWYPVYCCAHQEGRETFATKVV